VFYRPGIETVARRCRTMIAVAALLLAGGTAFVVGVEIGNKNLLSFFTRRARWSISIYTGNSPYNLHPAEGVPCPVLTSDQVTDADAQFLADPFMVREGARWYMFFEVFDRRMLGSSLRVARKVT